MENVDGQDVSDQDARRDILDACWDFVMSHDFELLKRLEDA